MIPYNFLVCITAWITRSTSTRVKRLAKELMWIGLGQAAAMLASLIGVRVLTTILSKQAYGHLALGMTVMTFTGTSISGPLRQGVIRFFVPAYEAGRLSEYIGTVWTIVLVGSSIIICVAVPLCFGLVATGNFRWVGLGIAAIIYAILSGYNSVLNGMQNAARQRVIVAFHNTLLSWGRFALAAGFIVLLGASSTNAIIGYCVATVLVLFSQQLFFRRTLRVAFNCTQLSVKLRDAHWAREIFFYAWPIATWSILGSIRLASDRWVLQFYGTIDDVACYAVLFQIGYAPTLILTRMLMEFLSPICFQRAGDASDSDRVRSVYILSWQMTGAALVFVLAVTIFALYFHEEIFRMLVSSEYHSASVLLPGMVLAGGMFACVQFASLGIQGQLQTRRLAGPKVVVNTIGIALNIVGAAWNGIYGVVCASVMYSSLHLIWVSAISAIAAHKLRRA